MHQPYMTVGSVDPDMQGKRRAGSNGSSSNWIEQVKLKIDQEAQSVTLSIPPYFRRFDAFSNTDYPSILKPRPKPNHRVAVAVGPMLMLSQTAAPPAPTQHPLEHAGAAASGEPMCRSVIVAAVGPYHHQPDSAYAQPNPALITHAKKCAIVRFIAGERFDTAGFLGWARHKEAKVRSCYERDSFTMGSEELAEMLLLDGCLLLFAIFLLRTSVREDQRPAQLARDAEQGEEFGYLSADILLHKKQTRLDLLMLGNQIPFFVLAELHKRLKGTFFQGVEPGIKRLALSCFDAIHPHPSGLVKQEEASGTIRFPAVHHLLHLFHWSRVPKGKHKLNDFSFLDAEPESHLPCAAWFEESQTSFSKPGPGSTSLDIVFQRKMLGAHGVMRVPALHIHDYSESVFRSLIAFEQSHQRCGLAVTAYSICMARLLQTEADAKLLRKSGILAHAHRTDKEIVDLFSGLADEYSNTFYSKDLVDLCKEVAAHHDSTVARAVKWVGLQCFPRQSITFFVIFGALISIATLINTGYSVHRFYYPVK